MVHTRLAPFSSVLISAVLAMAGCTAGKDASAPPVDNSASISGVVKTATTSNSIQKPGLTGSGVFAAAVSQLPDAVAFPNALILATDASGNTSSTTADVTGTFSLSLTKGKAYALIFINPKTLHVLGSLVQAVDTSSAAAVNLDADSALGDIVIDSGTGKAVSAGDAGGTVPSVAAGAMDTNGDGKITNDDVMTLQVNAIASGGSSAVQTMSVMTFMGEPDTWGLENRNETLDSDQNWGTRLYLSGGTMNQLEMYVRRARSVTGPKGDTVNAVKSAQLNVYSTFYGSYKPFSSWDVSGNPVWGTAVTVASGSPIGGYYNYANIGANCVATWNTTTSTWSWCGDLPQFGAPVTTGLQAFNSAATANTANSIAIDLNEFLNAWGRYNYGDSASDLSYEGEYDRNLSAGTVPALSWNADVPMTLTIGSPMTLSKNHDWTQSAGQSTYYFVTSEAITFVPTVETTITDKAGNGLPVLYVKATGTGSLTVYTDAAHTSKLTDSAVLTGIGMASNPVTNTKTDGFYVVGKYGAQVSAQAADGTKIPWNTAKSGLRFGLVTPEKAYTVVLNDVWDVYCGKAPGDALGGTNAPAVCDTTPDWTTGVANAAMPFANDVTTVSARDSWLVALAQHIDDVDKPRGQGQNANPYMWLKRDANGMSAEVIGWDPVNFRTYPLVGGTANESFTTTLVPDTYPTGTTGVTQGVAGESTAANYNLTFNLGGTLTSSQVDFLFELRTYDPNAVNSYSSTGYGADVPVLVNGNPVRSTAVTAASIISGQSLTANNGEYTGSLTGTLSIPDVAKNGVSDSYKQHWYYSDYVSSVRTNYCASNVTLWIVMRDISGVTPVTISEQPVSWYMVRSATSLGVADTCK